jgi:hypothetical protein
MRVLGESSEEEMIATFLRGELSSERFGPALRDQLTTMGELEELLTRPDLTDPRANQARASVLAATRGYGEDRELFEFFPIDVQWVRALLAPDELAAVRYIDYSYWNEISSASRLPADAARRIEAGVRAFDVPNDRFFTAARAVVRGERFPPLILAGVDFAKLAACREAIDKSLSMWAGGFRIRSCWK